MQVPILSQNDVSHLYSSVENNLVKYEEKRDPFHLLNKCKFVADTEISDNLDSLLISDDSKEGVLDAKNAFIVYSSIKNLTPYQARDERIIAAISHIYFLKYGFFRHKIKKGDKTEKIKKHFFARGNGARSIERLNVFSRLWWRGYFIDQCREDNDLEELLHLLCSDTDLGLRLWKDLKLEKFLNWLWQFCFAEKGLSKKIQKLNSLPVERQMRRLDYGSKR